MGAEKGRYALIVAEEQMPRHTGACLVYATPKGVATELNHVALFSPSHLLPNLPSALACPSDRRAGSGHPFGSNRSETVTEFVTDLRIGRFLPTRGFELTAWIHELRTDTFLVAHVRV